MHDVTVPLTEQPATDPASAWYEAAVPIFHPHEVLRYLFDDVGIRVPDQALRDYWNESTRSGIPWAVQSEDNSRIPLKLFSDDAQVNDQGDKIFAFVISCPLFRPKNSRTSKWPVAVINLRRSLGWMTIRPIISALVYSLNLAYDEPTREGFRFQVTEIGMDWKALRETFNMKSHWNSALMCHMCHMNNKEYANLPSNLRWRSNSNFIAEILSPNEVTPLILLRQFDVSCITWCSLHNLNLGLLWTINGGGLVCLLEMNVFGNLSAEGFDACLKKAYLDFRQWQRATRKYCSQRPFTYRMLFKNAHGAYFSAKGWNSRCICAFLADKSKSVLDMTIDPSAELQLCTHALWPYGSTEML